MMAQQNFKVLIVGGSISGLSMALMLEKNGIDFLVLEAYPEIAPQVGASIGLQANGLRILDQLGCYEEALAIAETPLQKIYFRDSNGIPIWSQDGIDKLSIERHGYPLFFIDRRMAIQLLYDHLADKSKILTSKRVVSIENHESEVRVITQDGQSYSGDIVIGADGVHSTVRRQMLEIAQKTEPNGFPSSEENAKDISATYACHFGIAKGAHGIEKGTFHGVYNEHFSYFIASGPGDRTYWFLFNNMGKTFRGSEIPRLSKEDEEELVKNHWNDPLTPEVRFSHLYERRICAVYTPLTEGVYRKWYFGRMVIIGDACHTIEPLTGQGGNNAIATSAALTNSLMDALNRSSSKRLPSADISSAFEEAQNVREPRAWRFVKAAHARQRLEAMETPLLKATGRYLFPRIAAQKMTDSWFDMYTPSVSLNMLEVPKKRHLIPYWDELLRKPKARGKVALLIYSAFALLAFIGYSLLLGAAEKNDTLGLIDKTLLDGSFPASVSTTPLRRVYTGYQAVDQPLQLFVTFFLSSVTGREKPEQRLHLIYFLTWLLPLIAIYTIEGYRKRNSLSLLWSPSFWGCFYQFRGIGCVAPLYYLAAVFTSRNSKYYLNPTTRNVPAAISKALLPALLVGYLIPTALMFFPYSDDNVLQGVIASWQPSPILVVILTEVIAKAITLLESFQGKKSSSIQVPTRSHQSHHHTHTHTQKNPDLPYLSLTYLTTSIISASVHITIMLGSWIDGSGFFSLKNNMLIPGEDPFAHVRTMSDGVFIFFQNDMLVSSAATFLWCLVSMWDLHRNGMSDVCWFRSLGVLIVGFLAIGPGATFGAVWYWREHIMCATHVSWEKVSKKAKS